MNDYDIEQAPTQADWDAYDPIGRIARIGSYPRVVDPNTGHGTGEHTVATGAPSGWLTSSADPSARPQHAARVTRSRKRGASFVVTGGTAWPMTVGTPGWVDPIADRGAEVIVTDEHGVTREHKIRAAADAILSQTAGWRIVSPQGNVTVGTDDHRVGGFALTDDPSAPWATARAMHPQIFGSSGERGIADATDDDPFLWCTRHAVPSGDCGCKVGRATIARVAPGAYTACDAMGAPMEAGAAWAGRSNETTVADRNVARRSVRIPRVKVAARIVGAMPTIDAQGRTVYTLAHGARVSILSPTGHGVCLGHGPVIDLPAPAKPTTRKARAERARTTVRRVTAAVRAERATLAAELATLMASLSVGGARPTAHGRCRRTRSDRWTLTLADGRTLSGNAQSVATRTAAAVLS